MRGFLLLLTLRQLGRIYEGGSLSHQDGKLGGGGGVTGIYEVFGYIWRCSSRIVVIGDERGTTGMWSNMNMNILSTSTLEVTKRRAHCGCKKLLSVFITAAGPSKEMIAKCLVKRAFLLWMIAMIYCLSMACSQYQLSDAG